MQVPPESFPRFQMEGRAARKSVLTVDIDPGAIKRSVSWLERAGRSASAVTLSRSYATSRENLWDAVTNGERISSWFLTVNGELEPGGRYQLEGNAGGVITACEPLSHFALTWEFAGDLSWVDVYVSDDGAGRTKLTLTHTALLSPHWDEYGPGAAGVGWELTLLGLAIHAEQTSETLSDEDAFVTSPEGRAFIAGSSEGWGDAAVAAGTPSADARAAARRTTAFYTGGLADPA